MTLVLNLLKFETEAKEEVKKNERRKSGRADVELIGSVIELDSSVLTSFQHLCIATIMVLLMIISILLMYKKLALLKLMQREIMDM